MAAGTVSGRLHGGSGRVEHGSGGGALLPFSGSCATRHTGTAY
jgi:hypothetical protein